MCRLFHALVFVPVLGATTILALPAGAQIRLPAKADLPPLAVEGTVEQIQMARGLVAVKSSADQPWILQFQRGSQVEVKGKAQTDFLAPGQYVIFNATVETKTGKIEEKVSKLTIFTPDMRRTLGVFPDQGFQQGFGPFDKGAGEKPAEKPAFRQPAGGAPAFGGGKGRLPRGGAKPAASATRAFDIHGQIVSVRNGKLSIRAPNPYVPPLLAVEIDESADIDVELAGLPALALVRPGDRIAARCQQVAPNAGQILQAEITLSQPLSAGAEGGLARKKPSSAKHAGKEKPAVEPKAGAGEDNPAPADEGGEVRKKPAKKAIKPRRAEKSDGDAEPPKDPEA